MALLPAEGLYGLHILADAAGALARLRALKGEPGRRPYIVLLADPDDARRHVTAAGLAPAVERRIAVAWPGPATLLLPAARGVMADLVQEGRIALRCPGSALLRGLARTLPGPLVTTSANMSGRPAPRRLAEVAPEIRAGCGLVVDAGELSGRASTVARVEADGTVVVLRPGPWQPLP